MRNAESVETLREYNLEKISIICKKSRLSFSIKEDKIFNAER